MTTVRKTIDPSSYSQEQVERAFAEFRGQIPDRTMTRAALAAAGVPATRAAKPARSADELLAAVRDGMFRRGSIDVVDALTALDDLAALARANGGDR